MAQFGGNPVNFTEGDNPNTNPRRADPETPLGRRSGDYDPPNTGGRSQSEAVRLARRGGSVAPPISDLDEKHDWIPEPNKDDVRQLDREAVERQAVDEAAGENISPDLRARRQGEHARSTGRTISDCPYSVATAEHYQWLSGWMQATVDTQERAAQL